MALQRTFVVLLLLVAASTAALASNCTQPVLDCSGRGQCVPSSSDCFCDDGYVTHPPDAVPQCNYKQTSRLAPFLVSLFVGPYTGAGYFMIGQTGLGVGQLLLFWGGLFVGFLLGLIFGKEWDCAVFVFNLFVSFGVIAFFIASLVQIAQGMDDGDGVPLGGW